MGVGINFILYIVNIYFIELFKRDIFLSDSDFTFERVH